MKRTSQTREGAETPTNLLFPKTVSRIGTWNVRTLYESGKAAQVTREMDKYRLDVLGLSEVRWTTSGRVTLASGHTLLYSGPPDEDDEHRNGVGLLLTKKASRSLMEWEPISERILKARFYSKFRKVSIIQCYAPTNAADQEAKTDFYEHLQNVLDGVPRRDIIIVLGDFNAKVGGDNTGREIIMGREGLGTINDNGEIFADFCLQNDLVIGGTVFPHRRIHKVTWVSPDARTENQIDHLTISRRWRRTLLDVRAYRGADVGTDHTLLVGKFKVKIQSTWKTGLQRRPRFDTSKLKTATQQKEFAVTLSNRFQALADLEDGSLEKKWERVKSTFNSTAEEVLGFRKREFKSWLSEETVKKVEERRTLKQQIGSAKTRLQKQRAQEEYNHMNREVKKSARKDKRDLVDRLATEAEEATEKQDMKTLHDITRQLSGRRTNTDRPVKDKDGNTLSKTQDQLDRWKEHFSCLLNGQQVENPPVIEDGEDLDVNIGPITREEVVKAVHKIKNRKAPGPDSIPPEALKADPGTTADILVSLLQEAWEREQVPEEWRMGYIVKLPKKGDLSDCQNWRGIQLLSLPSKVFTRIILERIKTAVDAKLRDEQAGFRAGRSCADQIATLRIIIEQSLEWQSPLYVCFVDFKKAFDMVDRTVIWRILRHYGIPQKVVNVIQNIYQDTTCRVIHNADLSEPFTINTGVRQGCLLSPMIFSLVIDWVMKTAMDPPRGIQWTLTRKLEDLDFADDISLLSHRHEDIQTKADNLHSVAGSTGLEISITKTKNMRVNATQETPVSINGQPVEDVDRFTYLGSIVSKTGGTDEDVRSRINKARQAFVTLKPVWNNKNLSLQTKLRVFNTNVKSVLLYGSETWRHTKALDHKLQVFTNTCLRQILRIRWPDRISNQELWQRTGQVPIANAIKKRKWRWIGHTLRREQSSISRQALEWNPQGKRKRGRPAMTWRRTLDAELKTTKMSWGEAKRAAQDRQRWRLVVEALCSDWIDED
jgi:hypothetical protein